MGYIYYNQRDYPHTPYPSKANPKATVASSGCGVCTASMAIENVLKIKKAPPEMASYSIENGARTSDGTDERLLLRCLCRDYPRLTMRETATFGELILHLQGGGFAVASTAGDRSGWTGIFSDSPHLFCVAGVQEDGRCEVLDPNYYAGKFNKAGRKGKVEMRGNVALIRQDELKKEIGGRTLYLIGALPEKKKEEEEMLTYEEFKVMMDRYMKEREDAEAPDWAGEELKEAIAAGITDGKRPQAFPTRAESAIMVLRGQKKER